MRGLCHRALPCQTRWLCQLRLCRESFQRAVLVHIARLAADEAFVNFDFSAKLAIFTLHRQTDAMEHEPCGFLSYAKRAMKLPRANAVLVVDNHPDSWQPLLQSERPVLEYRSGLQAELRAIVLAVALPDARLFEIDHMVRIAARATHDAIRPAKLKHEFAAGLVGFQINNRISELVSEFH